MKNYDPNWIWQTNDGTKIKVCDLTDEHLTNALLWLRQTVEPVIADHFMRGKQNQFMAEVLASTVGTKMDMMHILTYEAGQRGLVIDFSVPHPNPKSFKGRRPNRRQRRALVQAAPSRANRVINT